MGRNVKLSMRSDYGARAVVELARHYRQGPVQSADIAARQGIPEAYLEQLLTVLRKNGLIRSTRGPHGGHELARTPTEISCSDVVSALEGPILPPDCLEEPDACALSKTHGLHDVWRDVMLAGKHILDSTTIEDLVERQKARESRAMYYI